MKAEPVQCDGDYPLAVIKRVHQQSFSAEWFEQNRARRWRLHQENSSFVGVASISPPNGAS